MKRNDINIKLDAEMKKYIKTFGFGQIINSIANACFEIAQDERKPNTKQAHALADKWQDNGSKIARTLLINND